MGPYDLGRRRTRERQLLRSGWRKGPQPRGIRDAKARAERRVGHACLRRRTGSGKPQGSTGSDGSAGPRVLGRAQSSAAHGRIRGLPSSTRGRSRMDERPCPDRCGGCAVMRIPTVTGGRGSATTPPTRLECAFRRRSVGSSRRSSTVPEPPGGGVGRRFSGWRTKGATAANSGMWTSRAAWASVLRRSNACASAVFWRVWRLPSAAGSRRTVDRNSGTGRRRRSGWLWPVLPRPRVVSAGRGSCAPAVGWRLSRASRKKRYRGLGTTGDPALAEAVRVPSPEPQRAVRGGEGGGAGPGSAGGCRRRGSGLQGCDPPAADEGTPPSLPRAARAAGHRRLRIRANRYDPSLPGVRAPRTRAYGARPRFGARRGTGRSSSGNARTILSPGRRSYGSWTLGTRTAPRRGRKPLHLRRPCGCESGSRFGIRRSTEAGSPRPRSKSARGRGRVFAGAFPTAPPCCGRPRRGSSAATRPAAPSMGGSRRPTPGGNGSPYTQQSNDSIPLAFALDPSMG